MAHDLENMTPQQMLELWGLRACGTSLKDELEPAGGEAAGIDDELAFCMWLESTNGFFHVRALLRHLYIEFNSLESYRYIAPGETEWLAAKRHNQSEEFGKRGTTKGLARLLHDNFVDELMKKSREHPFKVPPRIVELSAEDIARQVESDVERAS